MDFLLYPLESCLCSIPNSEIKMYLVLDSFVTKILMTPSYWKIF